MKFDKEQETRIIQILMKQVTSIKKAYVMNAPSLLSTLHYQCGKKKEKKRRVLPSDILYKC